MNFKLINRVTGWTVFAVASLVYLFTIEPTASFWDCGEFIASAYKLEVGHPPGAPFFMLLGRLFSMFVPVEYAATSINVLSALSSSFTILFLYWSITAIAKRFVKGQEWTQGNLIAVIGSGVVGAMAYTFSDSFWFSAVEGEVYAMSSLFTAMVFWAILRWEEIADEPQSDRWLVLIAYLMGISIGVHLLNLLCIPAIAFVYYFRKYKTTQKGIIRTALASLVILGFVQSGIIPGTVKLASKFELIFVNGMGLPFNTGLFIYILILIGLLTYGIMWTIKKQKTIWNTAVLCVTVILVGYSSFGIVMIRSAANPPMDENNPENVFTLLSYLNREQYGDRPLLHGQYWMAPLDPTESRVDGKPTYTKAYLVKQGNVTVRSYINPFEADQFIASQNNPQLTVEEEYIVSQDGKGSKYKYADEFCSVFPRMYSSQPNHIRAYKQWTNFKGNPIRFNDGRESKIIYKPKFFSENLAFFFKYQIDWMYMRYFLWNFSGRQNDIQGHGNLLDGNYITGINFIDSERLGDQSALPDQRENNKGHNKFFLIPLILGIIGLVYQFFKDVRYWSVVMMLFLLTGLAIVVYLNQYPFQPRERDYAYAGSFYAFAFWIGLAVFAIYDLARNATTKELTKIAGASLGLGVFMYLAESTFGNSHAISYSVMFIAAVGLLMIGINYLIYQGSKNQMVAASLATIMGLTAPFLMAKDGWDDHSRAKRSTGVDFAKNYLNSCAPNAILFTNGDNDTFPLWYVQEVEGFRTDVRVVNLSLLNTDWYVNQMLRKAYDSDPVPFGVEERQIRQGTRDFLLLDDRANPNGKPVDIKRLVDFALDDSKKVPVGSGERVSYLPSKVFSLKVDKEKVVANGTVAVEDTAQIVDEVVWKLNKNVVYKNQFMQLALLANFNWDRPMYFAVTTGADAYCGLEEYFQLEGLAYRLVPIRTPRGPNPNVSGRIDEDIMFDNMMNNFYWGGMDSEDIYMDENNLRMTTNLRLQFANLAEELIRKNKKDKAVQALDEAMRVMPDKNVPFDRLLVPIIEAYYQAGSKEKAVELTKRIFEIYEQEYNYFMSLDGEFISQVEDDMGMAFAVNRRLEQVARFNGETEFADELKGKLDTAQAQMDTRNKTQKLSF